MAKPEKVEKVKEISRRLDGAQAAYFADYRGLSVPDIGEVRTALVDVETQFAVVKNTLTRLAVRDLDLEELEAFLDGPTAVAFVQGDIVAGAKALVDAAKRFPVLEVKGGLAEGRVLSAEDVRSLAALETREEMLARAAGLLSMHLRMAAFAFQALQSRFAALLAAYREKLQEQVPGEEPGEEQAAAEEPDVDQAAEEQAAAEQAAAEGESDDEQEEG